MTVKEFLQKKGYGPGVIGNLIHQGNASNMYLIDSTSTPDDKGIVFESIVEPTVAEVDLTPDTVIRDRPWYIEPSVSVATTARDNLPKGLIEHAQLRGLKY